MIPKNIAGHIGSGEVVPPTSYDLTKGLALDGKYTYVDIPSVNTNVTSWTAHAWFIYNDFKGRLFASSATTTYSIISPTDATTINCRMSSQFNFTVPTMITGQLYHCMVSYDNGTMRLYLNGVESSSGTIVNAGVSSRFDFIGKRASGDNWDGIVVEAAYWQNVVGTPTNASDLYNSGNGIDAEEVISSATYNIKFDGEGTESTVKDYSSNDYTCNLEGYKAIDGTDPFWIANDVGGKALKFDRLNWTAPHTYSPTPTNNQIWTMYFRAECDGNADYIYGNPNSTRVSIKILTTSIVVRTGSSTGKTFTIPARTSGVYYTFMITSAVGGVLNVFMDGTASTSNPLTQSGTLKGIDDYWLGNDRLTTTDPFLGIIDHFTIWGDYTGTATDATNLHNSGTPVDPTTVIASPLADYDCEWTSESQRTLYDISGNDNHLNLDDFTFSSDIWVTIPTGEGKAVYDRMTTPSSGFINALGEYVVDEQATENDNWALTENVHFYNVDTEVNALKGWKKATAIIGGNASFVAFMGLFCSDTQTSHGSDSGWSWTDPAERGKYLANDGFISFKNRFGDITGGDRQYPYSANYNYSYIRNNNSSSFFIMSNISMGNYSPYLSGDTIVGVQLGSVGNNTIYKNGQVVNVTSLDGVQSTSNNTGYIGSEDSRYGWRGYLSQFAIGGGIGFDPIAHTAAMDKFWDRMLIQKHIVEVNTVLSRYTDLTDREVFAIGRLVAKSVENGNWDAMDEVFMLGLYTEANALIGMVAHSGTKEGAAVPTHSAGIGFVTTEHQDGKIHTDYNSTTVGRRSLTDAHEGVIIEQGTGTANTRRVYSFSDDATYLIYQQTASNVKFKTMGRLIGGSFETWNRGDGISVTNVASPYIETFVNGVTDRTMTTAPDTISNSDLYLCSHNNTASAWGGTVKTMHIGIHTGLDRVTWRTDLHQAVNELEIGKAHLVDWDVASKTYWWDNRELQPDQLQELVTIINANCDSVTTGRILNLVGHLGVSDTAQVQIDELIIKGWTVTLI